MKQENISSQDYSSPEEDRKVLQTPASDCRAFVKSRRIIIAPSIMCYRAGTEDEPDLSLEMSFIQYLRRN